MILKTDGIYHKPNQNNKISHALEPLSMYLWEKEQIKDTSNLPDNARP